MPRSILTALVASLLLGVLGVADGALRLWAWAAHRPALDLGASSSMDAWLVMGAIYLSVGVRRRDPRVRLPMFWITLAAAIILGVFVVPFVVVAALSTAIVAPVVTLPAVVACLAAIIWGLSRPSARAWLEAERDG